MKILGSVFSETSRAICEKYGSALDIVVRPRDINFHSQTSYQYTANIYEFIEGNRLLPGFVRRRLGHQVLKVEPFVKNRLTREAVNIDSMPTYRKMENFLGCSSVQDSHWYLELVRNLEFRGIARHKNLILRTRGEILRFLKQYKSDVVESIGDRGFVLQAGEPLEPSAVIAEDGSVLKGSKGNHRFAVARLLNVERFPLKIVGVHRIYLDNLGIDIAEKDAISRLLISLRGNMVD